MRKVLSLIFLLVAISAANAQIMAPPNWKISSSENTVNVGDEVDIIFKVDIPRDWYLYSSDFDPELGPMVTEINFEPNDTYELIGGITPINPKKKYDDLWEGEYTYFVGKGEFRQKVKILKDDPKIVGSYSYQICTDVDGKCIPFDDEFDFKGIAVNATKTSEQSAVVAGDKPTKKNEENAVVEESPVEEAQNLQKEEPVAKSEIDKATGLEVKDMEPFFDSAYERPKASYWGFMIAAFLAGLAALLTPCVFPMIPMTVSFFTGKSEKNKGKGITQALIYGFSIVFIYTLIGSVLAPFMGPETANHLATEWLPNIIFFAVFVFFALSFFGMYDITLPSGFVNKMDQQADKGGFVGVFFMAFTLVLVSFSCTGPIVGTILVESAGGQVIKPILGMLAFSLAFAIPFTLFAIFPGWLNSLPKSGGWLNSVKVVLGFLELALAFKFLSIADQAFHWNLLDREVNIAIWIVIFTLMGFYLLGKIKLPHDSDMDRIGVPRLLLAIITLSFVVYLIPGMFGAPLKALAGYLPPMYTHDYNIAGLIRGEQDGGQDALPETCEQPKYANFLHLPHGLKGYYDLDQAVACAKEQNKPLFIDFTGHGCTNCREMEAVVWSDPRVLEKLKNDFVIAALYVDDKTELPEDQWYVSAYDDKIKKTLGKQNADLQIQRANNNAQPNYFLLGHNEKALSEPIAYDNVDNFIEFLDNGLKRFEEESTLARLNE